MLFYVVLHLKHVLSLIVEELLVQHILREDVLCCFEVILWAFWLVVIFFESVWLGFLRLRDRLLLFWNWTLGNVDSVWISCCLASS